MEPLSLWEAAKRGAKCSSWPTRFAARPDLGDLRVRGNTLRDDAASTYSRISSMPLLSSEGMMSESYALSQRNRPLLRDTLCRACKDRDRWDLAT